MHFPDFRSCEPVPGDVSVSDLTWTWECKIKLFTARGWVASRLKRRRSIQSSSASNTRNSLRCYRIMKERVSLNVWDVYSILGHLGVHMASEGRQCGKLGATMTTTHLSRALAAGMEDEGLHLRMMGQRTCRRGTLRTSMENCGSAQTRITVLFICRFIFFA